MDTLHYMYKITNKLNQKVYIGQSISPAKRWCGHKNQAKKDAPNQIISVAIKKHGLDNFEFEIIATCKSYENANLIEEELIRQFDSLASGGKGYNISLGGETAPKSEEWRQKMRDWHASLSHEEKDKISERLSISLAKYIEENGHPCQGRVVTEEEKELHRKARLENPLEYTDALRQKMSEAHLGNTDSEETKQKKADSGKAAWKERVDYTDIKCSVSGCEISGKAKYKFIDGIRYCNMHGLRMLRYGYLELPPRTSHNKGKTSHNRIVFTEDQIAAILFDTRSLEKIAQDFGVSPKVIKRVRLEAKPVCIIEHNL